MWFSSLFFNVNYLYNANYRCSLIWGWLHLKRSAQLFLGCTTIHDCPQLFIPFIITHSKKREWKEFFFVNKKCQMIGPNDLSVVEASNYIVLIFIHTDMQLYGKDNSILLHWLTWKNNICDEQGILLLLNAFLQSNTLHGQVTKNMPWT